MSIADIRWTASCDSTNALIRTFAEAPHGLTLAARRQTAGRGQRGNTWEAEPDKNLTFSIVLRPKAIPASRQFELSMLVALAVADTVADELGPDRAGDVWVKWPNDIYVGDRKVCGMLIENSLSGRNIASSIAGVGLNVNQLAFVSDAPNPVSLAQLDGRQRSLKPLLARLAEGIAGAVASYGATAPEAEALLERYRSRLWHGTGLHIFREPDGEPFEASVADIAPDGRLTLSNGRTYAFKEIIQLTGR